MESTASTFTVDIEGEKKQQHQQQKQNSIFFTYRYTNRKAAAASFYSCRKPGTPSRTHHTLLSNQPHYVSHNPYGSVYLCTPPGGQAGYLPPSLAPVCLSLSLSLPPPAVCKHPPYSSLSKHPGCSCSYSTSEGNLVKSAVSSFSVVALPYPLISSLSLGLLWFLFLSFLSLSLSPPRLLPAHSKLRF